MTYEEHLAEYFARTGKSQAVFSEEVGVKQPCCSHWAIGRRFPRPEAWPKITQATGGTVTHAKQWEFYQKAQGS